MKIIVGLGNPGKEYENTRHNSGFLAVDQIADQLHLSFQQEKWQAMIAQTKKDGETILLVKPLTYMNLSGNSVGQIMKFYKADVQDLLVIHDDMDLPIGSVRIRESGSDGGQKGMRHIIQVLGTNQINRIRIGVGHSAARQHDLVPDWVLSPVSKQDQEIFQKTLQIARDAAIMWLDQPMGKVMSKYNTKVK